MDISIRDQAILACRRLLSQLNRDPSTPTYGCFDRRYWAWKLIDFPEATFQRNILSLCWFMEQPETENSNNFIEFIRAGFLYTFKIQHKDGSFDQAYPNEHSYGATAFLLSDLVTTYQKIKKFFSDEERIQIEKKLVRSADFLLESSEEHGFIANHLAGAALALLRFHTLSQEKKYQNASKKIMKRILRNQSDEGWFQEYGGADPGYQSLCMYYLAQVYKIEPSRHLHDALRKSIQFLQFFIHPDGSFGGEYGSRRTEVYYPGGIALLSKEFPIAAEIHIFMSKSIIGGNTVNLNDIDMGNTAPLLSNYIMAASIKESSRTTSHLPFQKKDLTHLFKAAGLVIFGTSSCYAIAGTSNGGVLKVFSKKNNSLIYDDCGLLGKTTGGQKFSNQITDRTNPIEKVGNSIKTSSTFYKITPKTPSPLNYLLLRLANLTLMRIQFINEAVKKAFVKVLINKQSPLPLRVNRTIKFQKATIHITDTIEKRGSIKIRSLAYENKFSTIHMASSRYFIRSQLRKMLKPVIDIEALNSTGLFTHSFTININKLSGNNKE